MSSDFGENQSRMSMSSKSGVEKGVEMKVGPPEYDSTGYKGL